MLDKRFHWIILGSIFFHAGAVAVVFLLSSSSEKVYESIEVTSYVAQKNEVAPTQPKPQETAMTQPPATQPETTTEPNSAATDDSADNSAEKLTGASDSEITSPVKLITTVSANRTDAARKADYSGISLVELVVGANGNVLSAKLRNNLLYGLDDVALDVAKKLKFQPARIKDRAVATAILFKIRFESEK